MKNRILVAVVCIPLIFVIFYGLPPICLPIALSVLSMIGVYEVLWSAKLVNHIPITVCSVIMAGVIPFWVMAGEPKTYGLLLFFCYIIFTFVECLRSRFAVKVEMMTGAFYFAFVIPYFLSTFVRLQAMEQGKYLLLLPILVAFSSDSFALFAGMLFGKHKLAPTISPKKTVEGSVGGAVGAVVCTVLYGVITTQFFGAQVNYGALVAYGLLGSAVSQLGDLSFSYVKRAYGLKDFGKIMPGHGGVLDRFDSVIFCAPLMEILVVLLPAFVG